MTKPNWDEIFAAGRTYTPVNKLLLDNLLTITKVKTAIDVGCGTGELAVQLANRGIEVTGLDISKVAIEKAQKRSEQSRVELKLINLDFMSDDEKLKLIFANGFDLVIANLVVAFMGDLSQVIKRIAQLTNDSGTALIVTPVIVKGVEYNPRLKNISVDRELLERMLAENFDDYKIVSERYFDDNGLSLSYLATKQQP